MSDDTRDRGPDDLLLDELFERLVQDASDGRSLDLGSLLPSRPDLADRVRELWETAREVAPRKAPERVTIGGYEIVRELGRGGMGQVWLARHGKLGRTVALKVLPRRAATPNARGRFEREARAVARLEHPHIVPIYDLGEADGQPYFTMAHVEGRTLHAVLQTLRGKDAASLRGADLWQSVHGDGPPPEPWRGAWWEAAVRAATDVADALAAAHAQGVVHRDVKPSNVMLRRDGRALLFDFGLATVEDEATLTLTHAFVGTPHYASPEQAAGETSSLDERSDVWSLGATLYEALTLHLPFPGPTTHEVLRRIQTWEPEPPSRLNASVPRELETAVLAALEKDRARRYAGAAEFADDLRAALAGRKVAAKRAGLLARGLRAVKRNRALTELLVEQQARNAELRAALVRAERNEALAAEREAEARAERDRATAAQRRADEERRRAEEQRDRAESISKFLHEALSAADPSQDGRDVKVVDLLAKALRRAESQLAAHPAVRAEVECSIAKTYFGLGIPAAVRALADASLARIRTELPPEHPALPTMLTLAGISTSLTGDLEGGVRLCREAVEVATRSLGPFHADTLSHRVNHGQALAEAGQVDAALAEFRSVLAIGTDVLPADDDVRLRAMNNLGLALVQRGELAEARTLLLAAVGGRTRSLGPRNPETMFSRLSLGMALWRGGDLDAADAHYAALLADSREVFGETHIHYLSALNNVVEVRALQGRYADAVEIGHRILAGLAANHAGSHMERMQRGQIARLLAMQGDREGALAMATAVEPPTEGHPPGPVTARVLEILARREVSGPSPPRG